jgi:hypothetical protein
MARIEKGSSLRKPLLQPGYSIDNDGYGLLTCTATYKVDGDRKQDIARGTAFEPDPRLKCHKTSINYGPLGVATITAQYCGIAAGDWTEPNVSGSASLSTEPLTSHPNFFLPAAQHGIAGPSPYTACPSPDGTSTPAFKGLNGSIFANDGVDPNKPLFKGFFGTANSEEKKLYKRTAYLAPTSTFSGVLYTTKSENVVKMRSFVGKCIHNRAPQGFRFMLPAYFGDEFKAADEDPQLMISSVGFEDYGLLYKLTYELRFNGEGYLSPIIYSNLNV